MPDDDRPARPERPHDRHEVGGEGEPVFGVGGLIGAADPALVNGYHVVAGGVQWLDLVAPRPPILGKPVDEQYERLVGVVGAGDRGVELGAVGADVFVAPGAGEGDAGGVGGH